MILEAPSPDAAQRAFAMRITRLEDRAVRDLMARLEKTRSELAGEVMSTDWDRFSIPRMKRAVERAMAQFREEYKGVLDDATSEAWVIGDQALPEMVSSQVGSYVPFPSLDPAVLTVAQEMTGDLITDITADARGKIVGEIQRGLMGDRPITDVMRRVGRNLDDKGVFRDIADRAEVITRTETSRVYNIANHERDKQFSDMAPDLGIVVTKRWISAHDSRSRPAHFAAHGQEKPIDKPFIVGGEPLMFPLDPAASAWNTVNCRCTYRRLFNKKGA